MESDKFERLVVFLERKLGTAYADATKACVTADEAAQCVHIEYQKRISMAKIASTCFEAGSKFPEFFLKCKGRIVEILPRHGYTFRN